MPASVELCPASYGFLRLERMYMLYVFFVEQTNNREEYYCEKLLFITNNIYLSGLFTRLPLAQLMQ